MYVCTVYNVHKIIQKSSQFSKPNSARVSQDCVLHTQYLLLNNTQMFYTASIVTQKETRFVLN